MSKTQSELFTLTGDPDLFPQELRADGSGPPPPAWAMINPRKDNLRLCSSNDLYKRLFLTQPENALFLNDSVSCFSLSFSLPASLPSASFFFLLSPFLPASLPLAPFLPSLFLSFPPLPPFFLPVFRPSSFFLSLLRAVYVVWCVCDCQSKHSVRSQSRWDSVFAAMPTCSKRRVQAQKRLPGGHGLGQPPHGWLETRHVFWEQHDSLSGSSCTLQPVFLCLGSHCFTKKSIATSRLGKPFKTIAHYGSFKPAPLVS